MPTTGAEAAGLPSKLETARLLLRPLRRRDASTIQELAGDWEVARHTGRIPYPYPRGAAALFIGNPPEGEVIYAIERREDRRLIGSVGIEPEPARSASLGYWIGRRYWNRGYATEAVSALIAAAFASGRFDRLEAAAMLGNPASKRVQEKLGFRYIHNEMLDAPARGGPVEVEVRELLRPQSAAA